MIRRTDRPATVDDAGSVLVVVLIVMLVLSVAALAVAAIATGTGGLLTDNRSNAESRAAADAGLAEAVAHGQRTGEFCSLTLASTSAPRYSVSTSCADGRLVVVSTGHGGTSGETTTQAVYGYEPRPDAGTGAAAVLFGADTVALGDVEIVVDDEASAGYGLGIVVPAADLVCGSALGADATVHGDFRADSGCSVSGSVRVGGVLDICCGRSSFAGDVTAAGAGASRVHGTLAGSLRTGGGIRFGWGRPTVSGDVIANGPVALGGVTIDGTLTLPDTQVVTYEGGTVHGGVNAVPDVSPPAAPGFAPWFDFDFDGDEWEGYTLLTLTAGGEGAGTCADFIESPGAGWASLSLAKTPTVLDARACAALTTADAGSPVIELDADLLVLATGFELERLTVVAASGAAPRVWWVTEDTSGDAEPTCRSADGDLRIDATVIEAPVRAMAYTPCRILLGSTGASAWRGSLYGGGWNAAGESTLSAAALSLPGQPSAIDPAVAPGSGMLGPLISQRDLP